MIFVIITVLLIIASLLITYSQWCHQYWERKKLPYLPPKYFFGNSYDTIRGKEHFSIAIKRHYNEIKRRNWKHGGIYDFLTPVYLPIDLDYIKNIMIKDFQYFVDRPGYINLKEDPLDAHLLNLNGDKWHIMRTKLTPTFTSGKMKQMFQLVADCKTSLLKSVSEGRPVDMKSVLERFAIDIIGCCAFGLDCNALENENSPFRFYGLRAFARTKFLSMKILFAFAFPNLATALNVSLHKKDVTEFFIKIVEDTVSFREKNNVKRNDFMQIVIDLKKEGVFTNLEIAAQCFIFFLAGYETSSSAMTFVFYELARNPDIQQRAREEIISTLKKHNGTMSYDFIHDLRYLTQVIEESLRMYPPLTFVERLCVKDYKLPDDDIIIEKGTSVLIPVVGIHYDDRNYPNPTKFDPERFTPENQSSRHKCAYLPFGTGPRNCIGMRFATMGLKVALCCLLQNFKLTVNEKTMEPVEIDPKGQFLDAKGRIWLNAERIM